MTEDHETGKFLELITQYCSADQFRSVEICSSTYSSVEHINLSIQFRRVEHSTFCGLGNDSKHLSVQLSESLRYLSLKNVLLDPNFDWKILKNLRKLYLIDVRGINSQNFIEFLDHRPNLEVFHHAIDNFGSSIQNILEAMAIYCGNSIRHYSLKFVGIRYEDKYYSRMRSNRKEVKLLPHNFYHFLSRFENLKKVRLTTNHICCGDLIDAIKRLAENNTIEELIIEYSELKKSEMSDENCIFKERPDLEGFDMPYFSYLKKIELFGPFYEIDSYHDEKVCVPFKLLSVFGPQIISNVEILRTACGIQNWDFIKSASNLRYLILEECRQLDDK